VQPQTDLLQPQTDALRSLARQVLKRFADDGGSDGTPSLQSEHRFEVGGCLDEQDYRGLHIVGNPSSETTTVSLHLCHESNSR
jgi:hypothetical protein